MHLLLSEPEATDAKLFTPVQSSSSMPLNLLHEWTVPCAPLEPKRKSRLWFKSTLAKCWSAYLEDQKWKLAVWHKVIYSACMTFVYVVNAIWHWSPLLSLVAAAKSSFVQLCATISAASKSVATATKESWNLALTLPKKLVREASSPQTASKQLAAFISAACTRLSQVTIERYARLVHADKDLGRDLFWGTVILVAVIVATVPAPSQGTPALRQHQNRVPVDPDYEKFIIFDAGSKEASSSGRVHLCLLLWLKLRKQYKGELLPPAELRKMLKGYWELAEEATTPKAFDHDPCTLLLSSNFSLVGRHNVELLGTIENELAQRIQVEWRNFEWFLVFDDAALSFEWVETIPIPASTGSNEADVIITAQCQQASVAVSINVQAPEQTSSSQATEPSILAGSGTSHAPQSSAPPAHTSEVGNASSNTGAQAVELQDVEQVIELRGPLAAQIRDSVQAVEPRAQLTSPLHEAVQVAEQYAAAQTVEPHPTEPVVELVQHLGSQRAQPVAVRIVNALKSNKRRASSRKASPQLGYGLRQLVSVPARRHLARAFRKLYHKLRRQVAKSRRNSSSITSELVREASPQLANDWSLPALDSLMLLARIDVLQPVVLRRGIVRPIDALSIQFSWLRISTLQEAELGIEQQRTEEQVIEAPVAEQGRIMDAKVQAITSPIAEQAVAGQASEDSVTSQVPAESANESTAVLMPARKPPADSITRGLSIFMPSPMEQD